MTESSVLIRGDEEVQALNEGDEGEVVLDQSPFYARVVARLVTRATGCKGSSRASARATQSRRSQTLTHQLRV
jgi:alanyl-tRNA synthetase